MNVDELLEVIPKHEFVRTMHEETFQVAEWIDILIEGLIGSRIFNTAMFDLMKVSPTECQNLFCDVSEIGGFKHTSDGGSKTRRVFTCIQRMKKKAKPY